MKTFWNVKFLLRYLKSKNFQKRVFLVLLVTLCLLIQWGTLSWFKMTDPFRIFILPVILAGGLFGFYGGMVAAVFGSIAAAYYLVPPLYSLGIDKPDDIIHLIVFLFESIIVSLIMQSLRQKASALKSREDDFKLIVEGVKDFAIIHLNKCGLIRSWNPAAENVLGYKDHEVLGKFIGMIYTDQDQIVKAPEKEISAALSVGRASDERWHKRKDGSLFFASGVLSALYDHNGTITGFAKILKDETVKRVSEDRLRESKEYFSTMVDTAPAIIWLTDEFGKCTYLSNLWFKFTGRSATEDFDFEWELNTHAEDYLRMKANFNQCREKKVPFNIEYRIKAASGEFHWVLDSGNPRFNANGIFLGYIGTVIDINQRYLAELRAEKHLLSDRKNFTALESERQKLETIFMNSPAFMAVLRGPDMIFEKMNRRYDSFFAGRDVIGKTFLEAAPDFDGQSFIELLKKVFNTGESYVGNDVMAKLVKQVQSTSDEMYFDLSYNRIQDSEGKPYGVYIHAVDVTEKMLARKRLESSEEALRIALEKAESANRLKSAFLANMSHEIRTPLGVMMGFAELMALESTSEFDRKHYAQILRKNGDQLSVIINDIIDLSKVEAGHMKIEVVRFSLVQLIKDVCALFEKNAKEKNIDLLTDHGGNDIDIVNSDPVRLKQILLNLIGNAIKFTEHGKIAIIVDSEKDRVKIIVKDSGIGILDSQKKFLFKTFSQADNSITRRFGGTGLGLALSRRLSQLLGGDLILQESEMNKGSAFELTIKNNPPGNLPDRSEIVGATRAKNAATKLSLSGTKILLVDDAEDNRKLISTVLKMKGALVDLASDGFEAVEKALAGEYEIVLMDLQMPGMDGYSATQRLRELGYQRPIIALTAHAMTEVSRKCLDVGCTDHLSKPVQFDFLVAKILDYVR